MTQRNTGRKTAGIDGLVALTSQARAGMAVQVHATIGSHFGQDDDGPLGLNNSLPDQVAAPRLGGAAFHGIRIDFLDESLRVVTR